MGAGFLLANGLSQLSIKTRIETCLRKATGDI